MRNRIKIFCVLAFTCLFISAHHPVYLTVTEIEHNKPASMLEISCKFFVEDLEKTLSLLHKTPIDLMGPKTEATNDKAINTYISEHLVIDIDGKRQVIRYQGFEVEKESVFAYFEIPGVTSIKKLSITQNLLFESFDEQMGIIHCKDNGKTKSTKLQNPTTKASFSFPFAD